MTAVEHAEPVTGLSRRELGLIAAFWTLYGMLTLANRLFESRGPNSVLTVGVTIVATMDSLCWALLTVLVFWLVDRFSIESQPRAVPILLFGMLGLVVIVAIGIIGTEARWILDVGPQTFRGRRQGRPVVWFGMLYACVMYLGVMSAAYARSYSRRYHARREQTGLLQRQLAEARLDALRRQLDPHFLFNTLNAISSLVERDPRGVRRMISRLGDLLRFSLEEAREPEIPLRRELELLGQYIDIMQVRFQGRLTADVHVEERTLDMLVPALILQGLVENALKHGVDELEEGGRVVIEASMLDDSLVLRVRDDGPRGVHLDEVLSRAPDANGGVGIANTMARLNALYGSRQAFVLRPGDAGGTVAEIRLPAHLSA